MHLGDVLEPLIGVWGVVWRRVGLSGKRPGDFFAYLLGFLEHLFGFLAVSRRVGCVLEASWKRCQSILEASWGVDKVIFLILEAISQSLVIFDTFSLMYETALDSFLKGIWRTFKKPFACERH